MSKQRSSQAVSVAVVLGLIAAAAFCPAPADAYVSTDATLYVGGPSISYEYNNGPYTTNIGTYTYNSCNSQPPCSASGSGTVDASGTRTSSQDAVSLSTTLGPNRFNDSQAVSGQASARANLATGSLGVLGTGTFSDLFAEGGQDGVYATGIATLSDGLHFTVAHALGTTVTDIAVRFSVHGAVTTDAQFGPSEDFASHLQFGSAQFNSSVDSTLPLDRPPTYTLSETTANWVSYGYASDTADDIVFTGIYAITGPTADLDITATLDAACGDGFQCDFSHTGVISLSLPDGVSFTSDSRDFLTAPEPGSLLLLSTGLGLAAAFRWRSRRRHT